MVSADTVKYRALQMAVATGATPEVSFIWEVQRAEGEPMCFGQGRGCGKLACRWRGRCMALEAYGGSVGAGTGGLRASESTGGHGLCSGLKGLPGQRRSRARS